MKANEVLRGTDSCASSQITEMMKILFVATLPDILIGMAEDEQSAMLPPNISGSSRDDSLTLEERVENLETRFEKFAEIVEQKVRGNKRRSLNYGWDFGDKWTYGKGRIMWRVFAGVFFIVMGAILLPWVI